MNEYLETLKIYLNNLSEQEKNDAIDFYREYIQDSELNDYQAIVDQLGTPKSLAHQILADHAINTDEFKSSSSSQNQSRHDVEIIWLIILAIFSSPVVLPLLITAVLGLFVPVIVILAVLFAIFLSYIIIFIAAICIAFIGFSILGTSLWTAVYTIGIGLIMIGIELAILPIITWITHEIIHVTSIFCQWLYTQFKNKNILTKQVH